LSQQAAARRQPAANISFSFWMAAKLDVAAAPASNRSLPENVDYTMKSSLFLGFREPVPDVAAKLKEPNAKDEPFEEGVKSAPDVAVLVLASGFSPHGSSSRWFPAARRRRNPQAGRRRHRQNAN